MPLSDIEHALKMQRIEETLSEMREELDRAMEMHGSFRTRHEGYAVILEEQDELWAEVKKKRPDPELLYSEAIQVAAMALRFIIDLTYKDSEGKAHLSRL